MENKESHPIRNGIIAAVVAGIILSFLPTVRNGLKTVLIWLYSLFSQVFKYIVSQHQVYGWLLVLLSILSTISVIYLLSKLIGATADNENDFTSQYTKDNLFGSEWHWDYSYNKSIINLGCLCPICKSELDYSEFVPDRYNIHERGLPEHTEFICDKCQCKRTKLDGRLKYALSTVEREIRRKIRTDEWKQ